jgi:hypothetical protein
MGEQESIDGLGLSVFGLILGLFGLYLAEMGFLAYLPHKYDYTGLGFVVGPMLMIPGILLCGFFFLAAKQIKIKHIGLCALTLTGLILYSFIQSERDRINRIEWEYQRRSYENSTNK